MNELLQYIVWGVFLVCFLLIINIFFIFIGNCDIGSIREDLRDISKNSNQNKYDIEEIKKSVKNIEFKLETIEKNLTEIRRK